MNANISPDWQGSTRRERRIINRLLKFEETPKAIQYFAKHCDHLSDYWYWFVLGTLWVSYTGHSDLNLWRKLFNSKISNCSSSLMKPDELAIFKRFPAVFVVYRAHRKDEKDWISYTLSPKRAALFAVRRNMEIAAYEVKKLDILSYFARRGEDEILILDKTRAKFIQSIAVEEE